MIEVFTEEVNAEHVFHPRQKNSHSGISNSGRIKSLKAFHVNSDFLAEIIQMNNLQQLYIQTVRATDLSGLTRLTNLKALKISHAHQTDDFSFVRNMPGLQALAFENVRKISNFDFLENLHNLKRLGVEGSASLTKQTVESLQTFGTLNGLEELYLRDVALKDKDLTYLKNCPKLTKLTCARFAPKVRFQELREAMPNLECQWCEKYELG